MDRYLDIFTTSYIASAISLAHGEDGEELDIDREDLAPVTLETMQADCALFWKHCGGMILSLEEAVGTATTFVTDADLAPKRVNADYAGSDFWLTRNGHGSGFWDSHWPKVTGDLLTKAAKMFPEKDLYVGDDNKLYLE